MSPQDKFAATEEVELEGERFELRTWPYSVGRVWVYRLVGAIAPLIGSAALEGAGGQGALVAEAIRAFGEERFCQFLDVCEQHTSWIRRDEQGQELRQPLTAVKETLFAGRYGLPIMLAIAHGRRQFGDFFDPARLKALVASVGLVSRQQQEAGK